MLFQGATMDDFLFRGDLADLDPDVAALVDLEAIRQAKRIILIPSESTVPVAVRQAVGSVFHNIYAEGYPNEKWRHFTQQRILDIDLRLAEYRRYTTKAQSSPILWRAWRGGARRNCSPPTASAPTICGSTCSR
jgi:hypothetical protein